MTSVTDDRRQDQLESIARGLAEAARTSPEAFTHAMGEIWPEAGAMVRHEPALPHDGVATREQLVAGHKVQDETMAKVLTNYRFDKVTSQVIGDVVRVTYVQAGTLPDGGELAATIGARLTIKDGWVQESVLEINFEELAPMLKILGVERGPS